jgi:hypothetical protein
MFGRGHFQAGVIVDPKPALKFDPSDPAKLAEFRNKIWCVIPLSLSEKALIPFKGRLS